MFMCFSSLLITGKLAAFAGELCFSLAVRQSIAQNAGQTQSQSLLYCHWHLANFLLSQASSALLLLFAQVKQNWGLPLSCQKTREGCGCFQGLFGVFARKTPGKSRENCSRIAKCYKFEDFADRERQTCRELASTPLGPCPHLPCGVFFEIDSSSLLILRGFEAPPVFPLLALYGLTSRRLWSKLGFWQQTFCTCTMPSVRYCCSGQSAEMCRRIFCCINFGGFFLEDFPGGFFWALFPTKMRRKNPARKSAKKSGGPNIKSAKNPFCQNPTLTIGEKQGKPRKKNKEFSLC